MDTEIAIGFKNVLDAIAQVRLELNAKHDALEERFVSLKREISGSKDPPPPPDGVPGIQPPPLPPLRVQVSEHEGELAAIRADVSAALDTVSRVEQKTDAQSKALGIGKTGLAILRTEKGRAWVLRVALLALVAWATVRGVPVSSFAPLLGPPTQAPQAPRLSPGPVSP